jgi:hypothetical protein
VRLLKIEAGFFVVAGGMFVVEAPGVSFSVVRATRFLRGQLAVKGHHYKVNKPFVAGLGLLPLALILIPTSLSASFASIFFIVVRVPGIDAWI